MLNKSILFSVFVLCISCNDTRNPQDYSSQEEDTMIALVDPDTNNAVQRIGPQNENKTVNGVEEIIAEKGSLKLTFNKMIE